MLELPPYILSTSDLYLTPAYFIILFLLVRKLKRKYYSGSHLKHFILPGFFIHVAGSILFALIYQYYYGYGDTFGYFTGAHEIWAAFIKNPKVAFELIFVNRENFSQTAMDWAPHASSDDIAASYTAIIKIAGFIGLFCFGSYLPMALIFGLFAFWGTWLIFITINQYFPHLYKYTAIACLFIPSVVIWNSGISKEPLCLFALGLCFYSFDRILHQKGVMVHLVHFSIGAFLLLAIKSYIFYTFSLIGILWLYRFFLSRIGHYIIKLIIRLIVMVGIIWLFIYFIAVPDNFIQQLLADALTHGEHLQEYMTSINETYGGSGYTLPSLDLNAGGIIQTFFLSLNVTLFRPYVWECKNLLMVMSCIESFTTLVLILIVFFKAGIIKIISYCNKFPVLFFMVMFSLILAPVVGFISFNFGTLVRYKVPFLPFFISFLLIVLFDKKISSAARERMTPEPFNKVLQEKYSNF